MQHYRVLRRVIKSELGARRLALRRSWRPPADREDIVRRWQHRAPDMPLPDYAEGMYSQHGEDGMTVEVFRRIGVEHRRAAEICCGSNGGNAGVLVGALGWDALLVDGNEELARICAELHPTAVTISAWVDRESVGALLAAHGFADRLDYVGIDLDGNDYWIWDAIQARPRLVIVEFNPLFGPEAAVTIEYHGDFSRKAFNDDLRLMYPKGYYGASIAGLAALGRRKGYQLIGSAPNSSNAYFVRDDLAAPFPVCTPAEAWRPAKPGKGRDRLTSDIPAEGVHEYFRARGFPLVDVTDPMRPRGSSGRTGD